MKPIPYSISEEADHDIDEIWHYSVENWSLDQAERYYKLIINEIKYLCRYPNAGRSIDFLRPGFRSSKVKSHIIFYKFENESLLIVRILHENMDLKRRLSD